MSREKRTTSGAFTALVLTQELESLAAQLMCAALAAEEPLKQAWQSAQLSTPLVEAGVCIEHEQAYAALQAFMHVYAADRAQNPMFHAAREATLLRACLSQLSALPLLHAYLGRHPVDPALGSFRAQRQQRLWQCIPHVHPTTVMLQAYAEATTEDPALRAQVAAHLSGPYVCLACRHQVALRGSRDLARLVHDAGFAPAKMVMHLDVELRFPADLTALCQVRAWTEAGHLHLACAPGVPPPPPCSLLLAACFTTGEVRQVAVELSGTAAISDCGPQDNLHIDQLVGFACFPVLSRA